MSTNSATSYDEVKYPTHPLAQAHPDRLATMAYLFGLEAAPVKRCRVLEIGCGDGGHLIPVAHQLPGSTFVGIDLAATRVAEGNAVIRELGLGNITLLAKDILEVDASFGEFDYIVAHGIYSWVPAAVRDQLMAICGTNLSANGVAYISFNTMPGGHLRAIVRDLMRTRVRAGASPQEQLAAALGIVTETLEKMEGTPQHDIVKYDFELSIKRDPNGAYHDDLSECNEPIYFREFAEHAARHGLQFLSEGVLGDMVDMQGRLGGVSGGVIEEQQYLDFLRLRRFRQTLLCRAGVQLNHNVSPERLMPLLVSAFGQERPPDESGAPAFPRAGGGVVTTTDPLNLAVHRYLGERCPRPSPLSELMEVIDEDSRASLPRILLQGFAMGSLILHSFEFPHAREAAPLPEASPVIRIAVTKSRIFGNLCHRMVSMDDPVTLHLLQVMDGTRDRNALAESIGRLVLPPGAEMDGEMRAHILSELERNLSLMARMALLVA